MEGPSNATAERVYLTNAQVAQCASRKCKTCWGKGLLTVRVAHVEIHRGVQRVAKSSSLGDYKMRPCGCSIRSALKVHGAGVNPGTGEVYIDLSTYPQALREKFEAIGQANAPATPEPTP